MSQYPKSQLERCFFDDDIGARSSERVAMYGRCGTFHRMSCACFIPNGRLRFEGVCCSPVERSAELSGIVILRGWRQVSGVPTNKPPEARKVGPRELTVLKSATWMWGPLTVEMPSEGGVSKRMGPTPANVYG
ncbi:hypothetical protein AMTR_s00001p00230390 [Amborella trichopoda]|uniref:Uncharacterized protein n=1 Tax=Amborella trichopoda TaxID=13333 RepID=W1NLJ4_AMBTC|nr:hypothetical protein AMTR_s00001p00230390 [Amborella trichopoda]